MKTKFFEQYSPGDEKIKDIWQNGIVVFDTNVLLNLYRYKKDTCDDILNYMETFGDRLWMPYQVGWEYHNNRIEVAYNAQSACDEISKELDKDRDEMSTFLDKTCAKHPYIDRREFLNKYDELTTSLKNYLDDLKKADNNYFENDTILEKLGELYDGKVGAEYSEEKYSEIYKEGEIRFKNEVPPGYEDDTPKKRKAGLRHVFGDLIAWYQILEHATEVEKDVILVSDDLKKDWIEIFKGMKRGPRKELIKEFHDKTGHSVLIYNQKTFLEYAKNHLGSAIKEDTMKDVETVHVNIINNYQQQCTPRFVDYSALSGIGAISDALKKATNPIEQPGVLSAIETYMSSLDRIKEETDRFRTLTEPWANLLRQSSVVDTASKITDLVNRYNMVPDSKTGLWWPAGTREEINEMQANEIPEEVIEDQ